VKSIEEVIAGILDNDVTLSVRGDEIISSRPLLPDEKMALKENHAAAVVIIAASTPETAEQAYQRGLKDGHANGYALGIEHATEEFQSRAPVAAPAAQAPPQPLTVDEVMTKFAEWQSQRSEYWQWESECMSSLREALAPGDTILPRFAYSCVIARAGGGEVEFIRRPDKVKK
jgi:hypothetical protein